MSIQDRSPLVLAGLGIVAALIAAVLLVWHSQSGADTAVAGAPSPTPSSAQTTDALTTGVSSAPPLTAPKSFGSYQQSTDPLATATAAQIRTKGMTGSVNAQRFFTNATIATFKATSKDPVIVVIAAPRVSVPAAMQADPEALVTEILAGSVHSPTPVPPEAGGGALSCGPAAYGALNETICGWVNDSTVGVVIGFGPNPAAADLAKLTSQLGARLG